MFSKASNNILELSDNKPLPKPILTQIYVPIVKTLWHRIYSRKHKQIFMFYHIWTLEYSELLKAVLMNDWNTCANTMATDALATQETRASTAMVLT